MIFTHSGHLGDILYSLPAVEILSSGGGSIIYIKEVFEDHRGHLNGNCGSEQKDYTQYDAIKDLLLQQPYISEVKKYIPPPGYDYTPKLWPGLENIIDYDLDRSRDQSGRRYVFHVKRYFDTFGIQEDFKKYIPWLQIDNENKKDGNYAIFHVTYHTAKGQEYTERWNGNRTDWKKELLIARTIYDKIYFTGYKMDHEKFQEKYNIMIDHLYAETLLDLTRAIRDAQAVYCNQNVSLVIAQGLGKEYYLARNADRTHCHAGTANEHIL